MTTPVSRNQRLTWGENFKLCTWYKEHQERLLHVTDTAIVAEARAATGIDRLNTSHIIGARQALGIKKREERKPKPNASGSADLEALADQLAQINGVVQGLLDRVTALEKSK